MGVVNRKFLRNLTRLYADGRPGGTNSFVVDSDAAADAVSLDTLINAACAELWDLLIAARSHEYFMLDTTISIVANTATYTLASDFYELIAIQLEWDSTTFEKMYPCGHEDRVRLSNLNTWARGSKKGYRLRGIQTAASRTLEIFPTPSSAVTARYHYIPRFAELANDSATIDCVNGWEKLVALKSAIEYRIIGEKPLGGLEKLYAEQLARIQAMADKNDASFAPQVQDVSPDFAGDPEFVAIRSWMG